MLITDVSRQAQVVNFLHAHRVAYMMKDKIT